MNTNNQIKMLISAILSNDDIKMESITNELTDHIIKEHEKTLFRELLRKTDGDVNV